MKVTTCDDQAECILAIDTLNLGSAIQPIPPRKICDGLLPLTADSWIAFTNDNGKLTLHLLEDATRGEAWGFFDQLSGKAGHVNARIHLCTPSKVEPSHN